MGATCGILEDSFDNLYEEAKTFFDNPIHLDLYKYNIDDNLDEKIQELNKKRNKYLKIKDRTKDYKKLNKITTVDNFLQLKLQHLQNSKKLKIHKEKNQRILEYHQKEIQREKKSLRALGAYYERLTSYLLRICSNVKTLKAHSNDNKYIYPNNFGYISIETQNNRKKLNKGWIKAYHGTGRNISNDHEIKDMIESIFINGFKNGRNNAHEDCLDINHPGKKIGIGVYVTPNLETAKQYAGILSFEGKEYYTIFLVKVKKDAIRKCDCRADEDYWVVNGSPDEIIPYKILYELKE